jgi:hypothetical protein
MARRSYISMGLFQIIKAVRRYLHDFVLQIFLGIQYESEILLLCLTKSIKE